MSAFIRPLADAQNMILSGANAPRQEIERNALMLKRPSTGGTIAGVTPPPATPQNYRAGMPGTKNMTPVQAAFVRALAMRKLNSKTMPGSASWIGKLFGS